MGDSQVPSPEKKAKVQCPPNAFILYRKHHYPLLKEKNSDMHNNEVSIILGKQWNGEFAQVKNEYMARAEKIKRKQFCRTLIRRGRQLRVEGREEARYRQPMLSIRSKDANKALRCGFPPDLPAIALGRS
ncbi:uncharacterized protein HMPREF1541_08429 [Cyphellophora europaea CBS 101466]|uniref:HMG box domain-containing protein n=1 Tax=Cyphellophora europaea (strain CBS 101466) TaxID=1220924 RepID=W2RP33_CYPE1|nr:uncharacterized protein HMPREF1541_08429 [Cyphellophora europaea CBS 101466]ETN37438.1 hypothetical protein HMPREF1541_08429 [Cyphellophora europaea CBS 101466]